jgi:sugar/nucleoside kinase (ribokinase family)
MSSFGRDSQGDEPMLIRATGRPTIRARPAEPSVVASRAGLRGRAAPTLEAALKFASVAAALTCTQARANPPRRAEVEAFFERHGGG